MKTLILFILLIFPSLANATHFNGLPDSSVYGDYYSQNTTNSSKNWFVGDGSLKGFIDFTTGSFDILGDYKQPDITANAFYPDVFRNPLTVHIFDTYPLVDGPVLSPEGFNWRFCPFNYEVFGLGALLFSGNQQAYSFSGDNTKFTLTSDFSGYVEGHLLEIGYQWSFVANPEPATEYLILISVFFGALFYGRLLRRS